VPPSELTTGCTDAFSRPSATVTTPGPVGSPESRRSGECRPLRIRLHWVRDVTFAEDLSQIRTGNGPATMAVLRNLAISRPRLAGATNIAQACRHTSRHPLRTVDLLT